MKELQLDLGRERATLPPFFGVVAQLVERYNRTVEVRSSTLLGSTIAPQPKRLRGFLCCGLGVLLRLVVRIDKQ